MMFLIIICVVWISLKTLSSKVLVSFADHARSPFLFPDELSRYQLESAAEIGKFQRLILPLNRRIEGLSWYLNERQLKYLDVNN